MKKAEPTPWTAGASWIARRCVICGDHVLPKQQAMWREIRRQQEYAHPECVAKQEAQS